MKKFLAYILVLVLILGLSVGCEMSDGTSVVESNNSAGMDDDGFQIDTDTSGVGGKTGDNSSGKNGNSGDDKITISTEVIDVTNTDDADKYPGRATDLKGKVITVQTWGKGVCAITGTGLIAQRARTLIESIEKTLNCEIVIKSGQSQYDTSVTASLAAGKPKFDITWLSEMGVISNVIYNRLVPLNDLQVINFADRSRYPEATDLAKFDGKYYGIAPMTYGFTEFMVNCAVFANLDVLKEAGITESDLQKWVDNKEWNWNKLEEISAKVKAKQKTPILDKMDAGGRFSDLYQALLISNGADWISKSSSDTFTFTGNSEKATAVLDYFKGLNDKGYVKQLGSSTTESEFIKGNAAFMIQPLYAPNYNNAATTYGNYTILPLPIGKDANDYNIASSDYTFAAIGRGTKPSGATDAEIATVLDLLQTNLLTESENETLILSETIGMAKNTLASNTVSRYAALCRGGKGNIIWSHLILNNANGIVWVQDVYDYAAGNKGKAEILAQADTYNNILKNFTVKK